MLVEALDDRLRHGEDISTLSVDQLVKRAGVGVGSFCEYFGGRDALLGTLIGWLTRESFDRLLEVVACDEASLDEVARKAADTTPRAYVEHPARTHIVIAGIVRLGLA